MMTQLQYLLNKLAEEGSEVAKIALKTGQFGPNEVMPGQPLNNFQRCHQELDDLMAIVEMLNEQYQFNYSPNPTHIKKKRVKVCKYRDYSIHLGLVEGITDVTMHPMASKIKPKIELNTGDMFGSNGGYASRGPMGI